MVLIEQPLDASGAIPKLSPFARWELALNNLRLAWRQSIRPMLVLIWACTWLGVKAFFAGFLFFLNWFTTILYTVGLTISCYVAYKVISLTTDVLSWFGVLTEPDLYDPAWFRATLADTAPPVPVSIPTPPLIESDIWFWLQQAPPNVLLYVFMALQTIAIIFLIVKPGRVTRVCEHGFKVEAVRAGSEFTTTECPDFIGELWVRTSRFMPAFRRATIFRVDDRLHTAKHALEGVLLAWIKYKGKYMELPLNAIVQHDQDWVSMPYEPVSTLAMGSGKFSKNVSPCYVNIHNGDVTSMGKIAPHTVVGTLEYDGSTLPSFSGAPYYLNRVVMGMHFGASVLNIGYNASFMKVILKFSVTAKDGTYLPESSDGFTTDFGDQLLDEFTRTGGKPTFRRMANDFYVVDVGGKFVSYSEEEFEAAQEMYHMRSTKHPKKYGKEAVTAEDLEKLGVSVGTPRNPPPAKKVSKVLDEIPTPKPADFTFQDAETVTFPGNLVKPVADATPAAGPCSVTATNAATQTIQKDITLPIAFPTQNPISSESTGGLKRQLARQNVLSAITYDTLKDWLSLTERLERDGISPTKAEMDVLRELWFGQSTRKSEQN